MTARFAVAIFLIVAAAVLLWHYAARGETIEQFIHRVYPSCCPHEGCRTVTALRDAEGWRVEWNGQTIIYRGRVFASPTAAAIACGTPASIWCLLVPGGVT